MFCALVFAVRCWTSLDNLLRVTFLLCRYDVQFCVIELLHLLSAVNLLHKGCQGLPVHGVMPSLTPVVAMPLVFVRTYPLWPTRQVFI